MYTCVVCVMAFLCVWQVTAAERTQAALVVRKEDGLTSMLLATLCRIHQLQLALAWTQV